MAVMTGLSGNEIYCLHLKGMKPGDLVVGNSVFSMGFLGSLAATGRNILGGEVSQVTRIIHEGRIEAFKTNGLRGLPARRNRNHRRH